MIIRPADFRPVRRRPHSPCLEFAAESLESRRMLATFQAASFDSIQSALDAAAAQPGIDTVLIGRGVFTEDLYIQDLDGVIVRGAAGRNGTVIDGSTRTVINVVDSGHVTLQNLQVQNGFHGIDASSTTNLTLNNITSSANSENGALLSDIGQLTVQRGEFHHNGQTGLRVQDTDHTLVMNVRSYANGSDGFRTDQLASALRSVSIVGGSYFDNGDDGLEIAGEAVTLTRVLAERNVEDGIQIGNTEMVFLSRVRSLDNLEEGLELDNVTTASVVSALVLRNGDQSGEDGLNARAVGTLLVRGGTFSQNASSGLDLNDTATIELTNVRSQANGRDGLNIDVADSVVVAGGIFSGNQRHGMDVGGAVSDLVQSLTINRARGVDNGGSGLQVDLTASASIVSSTFTGNQRNGVKVEQTAALQLDRVSASRNVQDGVQMLGVAADSITVSRGTFSFNGEDGLDIRDVGTVLVQRAQGVGNADDGVEILNGIQVDVLASRFNRNGDDDVSIIP